MGPGRAGTASFLEAWQPSARHVGRGNKGVGAASSMTRNTNSPQRGAETPSLVKTRLSGFRPAWEPRDGGRCPGWSPQAGAGRAPGQTSSQRWPQGPCCAIADQRGLWLQNPRSNLRSQAPSPGEGPHAPHLPAGLPSSPATWKGDLEAHTEADKAHFQGG